MKEIFSVREVSRYLGFSQRKIYQLIKDNQIPYNKIGGQYRFIKDDIDNWLRKGKREATNLRKATNLLDRAWVYETVNSIKDTNKRRLYLIGLLTLSLQHERLKPIVVGGCALEFYTTGGYATHDIDIIFSDNKLLNEKLSSWGFKRIGRHWINEELDLYIESPASQLDPEENKRVCEVEIEGLKVYLIGLEDLILDRLKAYVHWKSEDDGYWAKELIFMYKDKLEMTYLKRRAKIERVDKALAGILNEIKGIL